MNYDDLEAEQLLRLAIAGAVGALVTYALTRGTWRAGGLGGGAERLSPDDRRLLSDIRRERGIHGGLTSVGVHSAVARGLPGEAKL